MFYLPQQRYSVTFLFLLLRKYRRLYRISPTTGKINREHLKLELGLSNFFAEASSETEPPIVTVRASVLVSELSTP